MLRETLAELANRATVHVAHDTLRCKEGDPECRVALFVVSLLVARLTDLHPAPCADVRDASRPELRALMYSQRSSICSGDSSAFHVGIPLRVARSSPS